ncbi:hypothetical protein ABZ845_21585 [Streptomyces sp. NPDC047022]|uniref:hypothetical protein n=1 Tax=Streptomyces sp. NPDC047022 TaxID=3155737 RepID=UPI0033DB66C4
MPIRSHLLEYSDGSEGQGPTPPVASRPPEPEPRSSRLLDYAEATPVRALADGWSWQHSIVVDGGAALGGLAVGAGVVAALPELGAVAAAGVGGVVVITATNVLDHAFHEHWAEDIHDHGVVGGVLHGAHDVGSETWGDFKRYGNDVKQWGKDAWHGVTSIF